MGRPPCCDKVGIKKGPWTPEEDIVLVSYIQDHGPGNWRSVPTSTGLLRCSKSCRLRWTNYLRPGIKRGNFTSHEEGMIVHLQALLGNKWAAIASYLPQRTDNDIKNYWNTHLKKKIKRFQSVLDIHNMASDSTKSTTISSTSHQLLNNSHIQKRSYDMKTTTDRPPSTLKLNQGSNYPYASSTENISRLLEGWMKSSPKSKAKEKEQQETSSNDNSNDNNNVQGSMKHVQSQEISSSDDQLNITNEDLQYSFLSFENGSSVGPFGSHKLDVMSTNEKLNFILESNHKLENNHQHPPLSMLETWLLDEAQGQGEEMMELSPISDEFTNF
ncbi:hypothetical protein Sjap_002006 [Stephania japonica]|uniref:Uncharacterized protein n=1 Tax=Stephania japonica TaxID=461633 RepID=A0AAP0PVN2_9MAGN